MIARAFPLLLVVVAAALVATGCGQSDTEKYREDFGDAKTEFDRELRAAGTKMREAAPKKDRAKYAEGAGQLQAAVTKFDAKLDDLDEPDEAKEEEAALVVALRRFSDSVGRIAGAVQGRDLATLRAETAALQPLAQQLDAATSAVERALD
jgi:hypothetical protein